MQTKLIASVFFFIFLYSCKEEKKTTENSEKQSDSLITNRDIPVTKTDTAIEKKEKVSPPEESICGQMILFKKGTVIENHILNAAGTESSKQKSRVVEVHRQGSSMIAKIEMETDSKEPDAQPITANYVCNGQNLLMDMTSLFSNFEKKGVTIKGQAISFPLQVKVGEVLPDASYSFTISQFAMPIIITTIIKNRKVEAKETVKTPAGSFECYKIISDVDAEPRVEGGDEKMQVLMKSMKAKMPKQSFIMWYSPKTGVVKVEMYSNARLTMTSEVTAIKK